MLKGCLVALVTPMNEDGTIDKIAFAELIEWHIQSGTQGLIIAGTTGEAATLDHDEQVDLISTAVRLAAGRIPIIAGTGTNSTRATIALSQNAQRAGANACLIVTPYYNRPTQKGLYQHYKSIAESIELPIILYNVPGRTACDLLPETVFELSKIKNIIGIKEATDKTERVKAFREHCKESFLVFSGNDNVGLEFMKHGADGIISVTANVAPAKMQQMCKAILDGNTAMADDINRELMLLHVRLFVESNPIPPKWALHQMGKIKPGIRLPLLPLDKQYHQEVKEALQQAGIQCSNKIPA